MDKLVKDFRTKIDGQRSGKLVGYVDPKGLIDHFHIFQREIEYLYETQKKILSELETLRNEIHYIPYGKGYQDAKDDFEELQEKNEEKNQ